MTVRTRRPSVLRAGCAGLAALLAGCSNLDWFLETSFPPQVPGLPSDQPWVSLPVGRWVTEGSIHAQAIAACLAPECRSRLAVGLFHATGPGALALLGLARQPDRLQSFIVARDRRDPIAHRRGLRTTVAVRPLTRPGFSGFVLNLSRPDGSHHATGIMLVRGGAGAASAVIVIGEDEGATRDAADRVVAALLQQG